MQKMKIQYASDLHLEFNDNNQFLMSNPIPVIGDVLVLAGDITYFDEEFFKDSFFNDVSKKFKEVFIVPGNHEYYGGFDIEQHEKPLFHSIRENVHFVNNITKTINDVEFIFTTLWSKLDPYYVTYITKSMNDFYKIRHKGKKLDVTGYNRLHEIALNFFKDALKKSKSKKRLLLPIMCLHIYVILKNMWAML